MAEIEPMAGGGGLGAGVAPTSPTVEIANPIVLNVPARTWFTLNEVPGAPVVLKTATTITAGGTTTLGASGNTYNDVYVNASAAVTVQMPVAQFTGQEWTIKDIAGNAGGAAPITVLPPSGSNIDGYASFLMNNNYVNLSFIWNGTGLSVRS